MDEGEPTCPAAQSGAPQSILPAAEAALSDAARFADALADAMQGALPPAVTLLSYTAACETAAASARDEAAASRHRAGDALRAADRAVALDAEAATWRLLAALHGDPDPGAPAGPGPVVARAGGARCGGAVAAAAVAAAPSLGRLARAVAWLESLAARDLDAADAAAAAAGAGDLFADGEAAPRGSRARAERGAALAAARAGAPPPDTLDALDPDAATRSALPWAPADADADARLCARALALVRAGRVGAARALCARAGAPWRAATLGSAAGPGLLPVGDAAVEPVCGDDALAAEADAGGPGALRALWRTAAAAVAAAARSPGPARNPAEAALYGVLGGDVDAGLEGAAGWHQCLWVAARSALEASLDAALAGGPLPEPSMEDLLASASAAAASRPPAGGRGRAAAAAAAAGHRAAQEALLAGGPALASFVAGDLRRWAAPDAAGVPPGGGRFAAHFVLALADVGAIPDPASSADLPASSRPLQDATNAILAFHCVSLVDAGGGALLPPLAARAGATARAAVVGLRLRSLRDAPADDAAAAYDALAAWLDGWAATGRGDGESGEAGVAAAAAAEAGRAGSSGGPTARAAAARWLWLSPNTLAPAAAHSCRVLRELALSGTGGAARAAAALLSALPAEPAAALAASPEELAAAGLDEATAACVVEMGAWARFGEADAAWRAWLSDYRAAEAARPATPSPAAVTALRNGAVAVADALADLVAGGGLDAVAAGDGTPPPLLPADPAPGALHLVVQPPAGSPSAARDGGPAGGGESYARGDAGALARGVAALARGLAAALPPGAPATATVEAAGGADAGLIRVVVSPAGGDRAARVRAAAAAAAALLKGALPGGPPEPATLVTLRASGPAAGALVAAVLVPRLLLRAAAAREAAAALGAPPSAGAAIIDAAADAVAALSRGEAQTLLERERRAVVSFAALAEGSGAAP